MMSAVAKFRSLNIHLELGMRVGYAKANFAT